MNVYAVNSGLSASTGPRLKAGVTIGLGLGKYHSGQITVFANIDMSGIGKL